MMKKKLCVLLSIGLFALAGCGSNTTTENTIETETKEVLETTTKEALESTTTTKVEPTKTVYGEKGTIGNPYSVSEALEIIGTSASFSNEKIYVTGIVSEKPYYDEKHKSYSAYLIDSDSYGNIQIYSGTIDKNAGKREIKEGDTVIAYGYYTYYQKKNQPELSGDSSHDYPTYVKIERTNTVVTPTYETKEDNGRETISTTIEFTEANMALEYNNDTTTWVKDNITIQFDEGTQYSWKMNVPYRFYVGSYMHISSTTQIKYILFETNSNYPFYIEMPVTNGLMEVSSNTSTYIFAKTGTKKIKIHNSNKGEVSNVAVKQVRITKITVVCYK
jgi:hypothetical protein